MRGRTTVSADPSVGNIEVTVVAGDAQRAADLANALTRAYEEVRRADTTSQVESAREVLNAQADRLRAELEELRTNAANVPGSGRRIQSLQAQLFSLEERVSEMEADAALFGAGASSVEQAVPPSGPTSPQPPRNGAIAAVVGFAIASALAYWRAGVVDAARLDPSTVTGAPLLAEIPRFEVSQDAGASPLFDLKAAEAFQFLVSSFEYALKRTDPGRSSSPVPHKAMASRSRRCISRGRWRCTAVTSCSSTRTSALVV